MTWRLGWCPWGDPASEHQERIEGALAREDRELREWIAMERFAEHERKESNDDSSGSGNGNYSVRAD